MTGKFEKKIRTAWKEICVRISIRLHASGFSLKARVFWCSFWRRDVQLTVCIHTDSCGLQLLLSVSFFCCRDWVCANWEKAICIRKENFAKHGATATNYENLRESNFSQPLPTVLVFCVPLGNSDFPPGNIFHFDDIKRRFLSHTHKLCICQSDSDHVIIQSITVFFSFKKKWKQLWSVQIIQIIITSCSQQSQLYKIVLYRVSGTYDILWETKNCRHSKQYSSCKCTGGE